MKSPETILRSKRRGTIYITSVEAGGLITIWQEVGVGGTSWRGMSGLAVRVGGSRLQFAVGF